MQWFLSLIALTAHAILSRAQISSIDEYIIMERLPMDHGPDFPTESNAQRSTLDLSDHSPNIDFRGTTFVGLVKACHWQPSTLVVEIRAFWTNSTAQYPEIWMWFYNVSAPEEPFSLVTLPESYGTWGRPRNPPKLDVLYPPFDYSDFRMDLVEAWQLARNAGWDKPLNNICVVSGQVKGGTSEVEYIFLVSSTQAATVGTSSKRVILLGNTAKRSRMARRDTISNLTVPSPDINFLSNATAGMKKALSFHPGALPLYVGVQWEAFVQYPNMEIAFTAGGETFMIRMDYTRYGTWDIPRLFTPIGEPDTPFEWSALTMDLPEAWERVQEAGWDKPLRDLDVGYEKQGEPPEADIWYRFYGAYPGQAASVGVASKKVVFNDLAAAEYGDDTVGSILPGLLNGTSSTSELGLVDGLSAGVNEVASS